MKKEEKNRLFWEPASEHKETYLKIIGEQINSLSKFILEQTKILDTTVPLSRIEKEIRKHYSFYWYHYLTVQLQYIKFWQVKLKDLVSSAAYMTGKASVNGKVAVTLEFTAMLVEDVK